MPLLLAARRELLVGFKLSDGCPALSLERNFDAAAAAPGNEPQNRAAIGA